jgi:excisionase family DNA binding protein
MKKPRRSHPSLNITEKEVNATFADPWAARFPPVLTAEEAAELLKVPLATIYQWSSEGRLKGCVRRLGKHLRFFRNRFLKHVFNGGLDPDVGTRKASGGE